MAISTYKVFLMKKADTGEQWSKLIDIKEFPDLGGEPEMLETTTLSDNMQTYIAGIQSLDGLSFTANYTLADFQTLKALEGKKVSYAVWFGGTESDGTVTPDGSNGKFSFDGELSVYLLCRRERSGEHEHHHRSFHPHRFLRNLRHQQSPY